MLTLHRLWSAHGCLTKPRSRALDDHLAAMRSEPPAPRHRPGSYSWAALRRDAEERFRAGDEPARVIRELRSRHSGGVATVPSVRTMRRWYQERRWLRQELVVEISGPGVPIGRASAGQLADPSPTTPQPPKPPPTERAGEDPAARSAATAPPAPPSASQTRHDRPSPPRERPPEPKPRPEPPSRGRRPRCSRAPRSGTPTAHGNTHSLNADDGRRCDHRRGLVRRRGGARRGLPGAVRAVCGHGDGTQDLRGPGRVLARPERAVGRPDQPDAQVRRVADAGGAARVELLADRRRCRRGRGAAEAARGRPGDGRLRRAGPRTRRGRRHRRAVVLVAPGRVGRGRAAVPRRGAAAPRAGRLRAVRLGRHAAAVPPGPPRARARS